MLAHLKVANPHSSSSPEGVNFASEVVGSCKLERLLPGLSDPIGPLSASDCASALMALSTRWALRCFKRHRREPQLWLMALWPYGPMAYAPFCFSAPVSVRV